MTKKRRSGIIIKNFFGVKQMSETNQEFLEETEKENDKKPKGKRALKIIAVILAILLLFVGIIAAGIYIAVNVFVDDVYDQITYDDGTLEWSGVDIDDPSYDIDDDMGIDFSDFSDPEADDVITDTSDDTSDDSSGNSGGGSSSGGSSSGGSSGGSSSGGSSIPAVPEPPYEPDYEILEGLFDGDTVAEEYDKEVVNILLIGADTLSGRSARSDTMILMSVNNIKKRIVFTSFMRDTYVSIPGYKDNRLNAAYAAGGPNLLIKTLKQNFDITVDFYVTVSISSFQQAVDVIGGLDITVNENNYDYFKTDARLSGLTQAQATDGTRRLHLTGIQALVYARSRAFSGGDFTRTLHQRDLLTQTVENCKGKSLSELHELLKAVLPYVVTNIPKATLKSFIWNALTYISYDITSARVPCAGSYSYANINGREVLAVNFNANKKFLKAKIYG